MSIVDSSYVVSSNLDDLYVGKHHQRKGQRHSNKYEKYGVGNAVQVKRIAYGNRLRLEAIFAPSVQRQTRHRNANHPDPENNQPDSEVGGQHWIPQRMADTAVEVDCNAGQEEDGALHERGGHEGGQFADLVRESPAQSRRRRDPEGKDEDADQNVDDG